MRFEIDARLVEVRERRLVSRFGGGRLADIGLPLLHGDGDVAELLAPNHFGVARFRRPLASARPPPPPAGRRWNSSSDRSASGDRPCGRTGCRRPAIARSRRPPEGRSSRHRRGPCRRASMARPCNIARPASRARAATATATTVARTGRMRRDDKTDRRLIAGQGLGVIGLRARRRTSAAPARNHDDDRRDDDNIERKLEKSRMPDQRREAETVAHSPDGRT